MAPSSFVRDRFTWLAYWMLAYYAYLQAALGPLVPFLRGELHLSYTISGLHLSAFSAGMILAGLTVNPLVHRWGRRRVFWAGGAGMAAGAILLILGQHAALTIAATLLMGLPGTWTLILIQATLSDRHGEQRAIALTESNVIASMGAGIAPLLIGGLQRLGIGWRGAPVAGVLAWLLLLLVLRRESLPASQPVVRPSAERRAPLPRLYWIYWLVAFLVVSVEWCIIFWGAEFLENNVGLSRVTAATLMSVFFLAMLIGRFVGSRLTRVRAVTVLLPLALVIALLGFVPFWLAPWAALNIAGLFVAGLGVANLFPFSLSALYSVIQPHQQEQAGGRLALATGSAILFIPQALGTLADQAGIRSAYGVVAVFLLLALGVIVLAGRHAQQLDTDRAYAEAMSRRGGP